MFLGEDRKKQHFLSEKSLTILIYLDKSAYYLVIKMVDIKEKIL